MTVTFVFLTIELIEYVRIAFSVYAVYIRLQAAIYCTVPGQPLFSA
jgi:hypothetical protein